MSRAVMGVVGHHGIVSGHNGGCWLSRATSLVPRATSVAAGCRGPPTSVLVVASHQRGSAGHQLGHHGSMTIQWSNRGPLTIQWSISLSILMGIFPKYSQDSNLILKP